MAWAYSQDLRTRVLVAAHAGKHSHGAVPPRFGPGPRTVEALYSALAARVDRITPADARSFFLQCGYGQSAQP